MTLIGSKTIQQCDSLQRAALECKYTLSSQSDGRGNKLNMSDNYAYFPTDVEIIVTHFKPTKVICVTGKAVRGDTDFNCLLACLLYPIMPLCFTHTVGCRIALWLMHPPRAPRSSELTVAEAGGNLLGYNLICFPSSIWHIPRTPTEAGELRACTSCKNTINLFCLIQDSVCVDAWFVNVSFCSNWCICLCNTQFTLLNFPPCKKQLFYCCKLMNGRWTEEWTLVIWILGSSLRWWVTLDREWLNHPKR